MHHFSHRKLYVLLYLALCVGAVLIYLKGLHGPFLFDDYGNIVDNRAIQINELSIDALRASLGGPEAGPLGRPVSVLSFALNHYAFGLDPFHFKAVNLAIHLANGALLLVLLTLLMRHSRFSASGAGNAFVLCVAAVWLLHPINVLPVLMAVQRMTLLAGLFTLIALICHVMASIRGGPPSIRILWLAAGWGLAWPLAVLAKETAMLFPLYALILSWGLAQTQGAREAMWLTLLGMLAFVAAVAGFFLYLGFGWLDAGYAMRPFSMIERLMTEARVLWLYAGQILVPSYAKFGLFLDGIPISRGLADPGSTWVALVAWLGVALALFALLRSQRLVALAIFWFLAGHSLESSVLPLEIAHEHRNYLPSIGLIVAAGLGVQLLAKRIGVASVRRLVVVGVACVALVFASLYTWMRANQYSDEVAGALAEVSYHPNSPRANYGAASILMQHRYGASGDPLGEVLVQYHFEEAGRVDPTFKLGYVGLIVWTCSSGRPLDGQWIEELARRLEFTPFGPKDRELPTDLFKPLSAFAECVEREQALALFGAGSRNMALAPARRANFLELAADYELVVHGDVASAIEFLRQTVDLSPSRHGAREKLESLEQLHKIREDASDEHTRNS